MILSPKAHAHQWDLQSVSPTVSHLFPRSFHSAQPQSHTCSIRSWSHLNVAGNKTTQTRWWVLCSIHEGKKPLCSLGICRYLPVYSLSQALSPLFLSALSSHSHPQLFTSFLNSLRKLNMLEVNFYMFLIQSIYSLASVPSFLLSKMNYPWTRQKPNLPLNHFPSCFLRPLLWNLPPFICIIIFTIPLKNFWQTYKVAAVYLTKSKSPQNTISWLLLSPVAPYSCLFTTSIPFQKSASLASISLLLFSEPTAIRFCAHHNISAAFLWNIND